MKPKTDKSLSEILVEQEIQRLEENEAEITRLKKQMKPKTDNTSMGNPPTGTYFKEDKQGWEKADEFWGWFKLKMEEAYKRGREDEAIECQKNMERVVEDEKKRFVKQANDVRKILEEEKNTGTGAYDVTTRAGKKRFRDMLRELVKLC
jgi:hypothetical protein